MAGVSRIHWLLPVGMVGALFVGFLFALGHHLFYASLAGTPAPTGTYDIVGASISQQQLNTAVGTAFGFLVKSFLIITISIAFIQAFWRAARAAKKGSTLSSLDSAYSLLSNFLGLFDIRVWTNFRLPLVLALIAWYVLENSPHACTRRLTTREVCAHCIYHHTSYAFSAERTDYSDTFVDGKGTQF